MFAGLTSMIGPMMGGMAGGSFQPGSSAKDQAQSAQNAKYAQFRSGVQNTMQGTMFGMSPAMQLATNLPVQSKEVGQMGAAPAQASPSGPAQASPSGWDSFLRGAASFAGNFATGVAAGLQSYDPNRPLSAIAGGYLGATRGLQTQADIEEARVKGAAGLEMRREQSAAELEARRAQQASDIQMGEQRIRAESRLEEDLARQAAAGASIMQPGMGGVMAGVQQPGRSRLDDAGVQVGSFLATENILRLIGMQR